MNRVRLDENRNPVRRGLFSISPSTDRVGNTNREKVSGGIRFVIIIRFCQVSVFNQLLYSPAFRSSLTNTISDAYVTLMLFGYPLYPCFEYPSGMVWPGNVVLESDEK